MIEKPNLTLYLSPDGRLEKVEPHDTKLSAKKQSGP